MKTLLLSSLVLLLLACSVSKSTVENGAVSFMKEFEQSLAKKDSSVLDLFTGSQSRNSIKAAIEFLRNPEPENLNCQPNFNQPTIVWDSLGLRALVNVALTAEDYRDTSAVVTFWLKRTDGKFLIDKLEAEQFHALYASMIYDIHTADDIERNTARMEKYLAAARNLRQSYDSVVWFAIQDTSAIFYVVNGSWSQPGNDERLAFGNFKMGLVDASGKILVPVDYDLIGSPGAFMSGYVEVQKDGKIGYFSLEGKQVIPPIYDRSINVEQNNEDLFAHVVLNSAPGYIDSQFQYHAGYKPGSDVYLDSYGFMNQKVNLNEDNYTLCHIPSVEYANEGIIIPPAYMVEYGMFNDIESGFTAHDIGAMQADENYGDYMGTQYISQEDFRKFDVTGSIKLLISTFKSRFLGGREEFYYSDHLLLVNDSLHTKSEPVMSYASNAEFRNIGNDILEAKSPYSGEPNEFGCYNCPNYTYFRIDGMRIEKLEGYGTLNFIQYATLDSSYFTGSFNVYSEQGNDLTLDFLPRPYIEALRNEILARNGYRFKDETLYDQYTHEKWYEPQPTYTYDIIRNGAQERDRHNLLFLEKILGRPDENI